MLILNDERKRLKKVEIRTAPEVEEKSLKDAAVVQVSKPVLAVGKPQLLQEYVLMFQVPGLLVFYSPDVCFLSKDSLVFNR